MARKKRQYLQSGESTQAPAVSLPQVWETAIYARLSI